MRILEKLRKTGLAPFQIFAIVDPLMLIDDSDSEKKEKCKVSKNISFLTMKQSEKLQMIAIKPKYKTK